MNSVNICEHIVLLLEHSSLVLLPNDNLEKFETKILFREFALKSALFSKRMFLRNSWFKDYYLDEAITNRK